MNLCTYVFITRICSFKNGLDDKKVDFWSEMSVHPLTSTLSPLSHSRRSEQEVLQNPFQRKKLINCLRQNGYEKKWKTSNDF